MCLQLLLAWWRAGSLVLANMPTAALSQDRRRLCNYQDKQLILFAVNVRLYLLAILLLVFFFCSLLFLANLWELFDDFLAEKEA